MRLRTNKAAVILLGALLLAGGCGSHPREPQHLRVAVLPILDVLPLYVAESEGYFAEAGIQVELVPAASAAERDQLVQAGQVDGFVTDPVALALYNRDGLRVVAVRHAMLPTASMAQFRVLAAGSSGIAAPEGLRNIPIGVSEGTIIEYVTRKLLELEGLAPQEITVLGVPKIPDRMALLSAGDLQAATLPEPLASLAVQQGAVVVLSDSAHPQLSCSLFAFRAEVLEAQPETVRAFLRTVDRASTAINADKPRWEGLLEEKGLLPAPLVGSYTLPDYPGNSLLMAAQYADVIAWLQEGESLADTSPYEEAVRDEFLP